MGLPTVRDYMDTATCEVPPDMPILEAVRHLMACGLTGVPVVDASGTVLGMLTELGCLRLLTAGDRRADVPTGIVRDHLDADAPIVEPRHNIYYVAGLFLKDPTHRRFAVVEDGRLIGVITRKDLLRVLEKDVIEE